MTSHPVNLVSDFHKASLKMSLRDLRKATENGRGKRKIVLEKSKKNLIGSGWHPPPLLYAWLRWCCLGISGPYVFNQWVRSV